MKKNTFYVFHCKTESGKDCAYALTIPNSNNLVGYFTNIPDLVSVNACDTRKEAEKIARFWNDCFKKNGTYAF